MSTLERAVLRAGVKFYKNRSSFPFDLKLLFIHFVDFMSSNKSVIYPDVTRDDINI